MVFLLKCIFIVIKIYMFKYLLIYLPRFRIGNHHYSVSGRSAIFSGSSAINELRRGRMNYCEFNESNN